MDLLNNLYLQGGKLWDVLKIPGAAGALYALICIHRYYERSIRHILALLALPAAYIACVSGASFLGMTAISHRYYEPVAPLLLVFSALGIYGLCRDIGRKTVVSVLLAVILGGLLADAVSPPLRAHRRVHPKAGRWLHRLDPEYDGFVFSDNSQISYYAGMKHSPAPGARRLHRRYPDVAESVKYAVFEADRVRLQQPGESDAPGGDRDAVKRPDPARVESGVVRVDHQWETVSFQDRFREPVVVAGPPTMAGGQPGAVRLRRVAGGSFDIRFQEWPEWDGEHLREVVRWLALESGCWPGKRNSAVEARNVTVTGDGWTHVAFEGGFAARPIVFTQVRTANTESAVTARVRNVTKDGFEIALFTREGAPEQEEVGFVALDPRVSRLGGSEWRVGTASREIGQEPVVVRAAGQDYTLRLQGPGWDREERDTVSERVGLLCRVGEPHPLAQVQSSAEPGHVVLRSGGSGTFWLRQHVRDEGWDLIYSEGSRNLRIYRNPSASKGSSE